MRQDCVQTQCANERDHHAGQGDGFALKTGAKVQREV